MVGSNDNRIFHFGVASSAKNVENTRHISRATYFLYLAHTDSNQRAVFTIGTTLSALYPDLMLVLI